jgi:hypothetical protein
MNGPAPTLVNDWITAPFMWFVVGAFVAVSIGVWLGEIIREDRIRAMDLDEMDEQVQTERHCAARGHRYVKVPTPTRWRCGQCGDVVESKAGWVA